MNWRSVPLERERPDLPQTFEAFIDGAEGAVRAVHAGVRRGGNRRRRRDDRRGRATPSAAAGTAFATHSWRAAASGNLWGWQITRCLYLLVVLTGSLGAVGGVNLHVTNKFVPKHSEPAAAAGILERAAVPARVSRSRSSR